MISFLTMAGLAITLPQGGRDTGQLAAALQLTVAAPEHPTMRWGTLDDVRSTLVRVLSRRDWKPLWLNGDTLSVSGGHMLAELLAAGERGLDPSDYDAVSLASTVPRLPRAAVAERAAFDVALSAGALRYATALHSGRIDPRRWYPLLPVRADTLNRAATLQALAASGHPDSILRRIEPGDAGYRRLLDLLATFRASLTDTDGLTLPQVLHRNDPFPGAAALRRRLRLLGELGETARTPGSATYDDTLVAAVKRFQRHQALAADGVLAGTTRARLLTPVSDRIRQIELTLEQWRWLSGSVDEMTIEVNIPAQQLRVIDSGRTTLAMDVIIGRTPGHLTPIMAARVTGIAFRPAWLVPSTIAREEIRPQAIRDSLMLAREGFDLLHHDSIVPATRSNVRRIGVDIEARQRPGPLNPLGRLKLEMPNPGNIYLHDTPDRKLFARPERTFSHGCVRLADARALGRLLLARSGPQGAETFDAAYATDTTNIMPLPVRVPVRIVYHTVDVDDRGVPAFYRDLYRLEPRLDSALHGGYPYTPATTVHGGALPLPGSQCC